MAKFSQFLNYWSHYWFQANVRCLCVFKNIHFHLVPYVISGLPSLDTDDVATSIAVALIHSCLDYANLLLLCAISATNIHKLQRCQNTAIHLFCSGIQTLMGNLPFLATCLLIVFCSYYMFFIFHVHEQINVLSSLLSPHCTAVLYSFCLIPHGPASLASNPRSVWLQNRHSDLQDSVFWPSGVPSWIISSCRPSHSLWSSKSTSLNCPSCKSQVISALSHLRSSGTSSHYSFKMLRPLLQCTFKRRLKSFYFRSLLS